MTVQWNGDDVRRVARQGAERGLVEAVEQVRNTVVRLMVNSPRSGRVYRRRGTLHRASAPGEPPAPDTGRLVNSITTVYDLPNLQAGIRAATTYAAFLEFGTSRMQPRPFMRPAIALEERNVGMIVNRAIKRALDLWTKAMG